MSEGPWGRWDDPLTEYPMWIDRTAFPTEQAAAAEAWSWFTEVGEADYLGNAPVSLTGKPVERVVCTDHEECMGEDYETGDDLPCARLMPLWEMRFEKASE